MFPAKLSLLGTLVVAGFLCVYCLMLAKLFLADQLRGQLESSGQWQQWFGSGFTNHMFGSQVLRVGVAGIVIAVLFCCAIGPVILSSEGQPERNGRANPLA